MMMKKKKLFLIFIILIIWFNFVNSQSAINVGSGSYAEYPPVSEGTDVYNFAINPVIYSLTGVSNIPLPTNDWWTYLLVNQYGGENHVYPFIVQIQNYGIRVCTPNKWNAGGTDVVREYWIEIRSSTFNPTAALAKRWHDWGVEFRMPDGSKYMDITMVEGIPYIYCEFNNFNPQIVFPTTGAIFFNDSGENISLPTAGSNIALGKLAVSSSTEGGYVPGRACDGSTTTRWSSQFYDPQWIKIDLGYIYNIHRVVLNWEAAYAKSYEIQVSTNDVNWTTIYSTTNGDGGIDNLNITGRGRYIRMYGTKRATGYGYSLWEFEVYGSGGPTNVITDHFGVEYGGRYFGIHLSPNTKITQSGNTLNVKFEGADKYIIISSFPNRSDLTYFHQYAYSKPTNTKFEYSYNPNLGKISVTFKVETKNLKNESEKQTVQGFLPHHYKYCTVNFGFNGREYFTARGRMKAATGNSFNFEYNFNGLLPTFYPPTVNTNENHPYNPFIMNELIDYFNRRTTYGGDTYWGGKDILNYAKYAHMAYMVNHLAKDELISKARAALRDWLTYTPGETEHYYAYYPAWKALVGFNTSYGSERFTDHHFHYGYLTYAVALLGMIEPDFLSQYGEMAKLVAKEYANWDRNDNRFPLFRTFNIWRGHSYAGGSSSPTGNNQESTSEAIQSWAGIYFLGAVLNDPDMMAAGAVGWLYETRATLEYWFDWDNENLSPNYAHSMVGILWDGGVVYATYFGTRPIYIHGIQYLPETPAFSHFAINPNWALQEYNALMQESYEQEGVTDELGFGGDWGNVAMGMRLMWDPEYVTAKFDTYYSQKSTNTRANDFVYDALGGITYYYSHAMQNYGRIRFDFHTSLPLSQVFSNSSTGEFTIVVYNTKNTPQNCIIYRGNNPEVSFNIPAYTLMAYKWKPGSVPIPIGTGTGLWAVYYDNMDLTDAKVGKIDKQINFNFGTGSPVSNVSSNTYSIRWEGQIEPPFSETYTFYLNIDDGARLWVNNVLLIDRWQERSSSSEFSNNIFLSSGQKYDIKIEYFKNTGTGTISLKWKSPSISKEIIPQSQLYPIISNEPLGVGKISIQYWTNITGAAIANLTNNSRYPNNPSYETFLTNYFEIPMNIGNNYGARIRGFIHPPLTGEYIFWISSDDNSALYLSTYQNPQNKQLIASVPGYTGVRDWNKYTEQKSQKIFLEAGKRYYIEVLYKEGGGNDHCAVGWLRPDENYERPIPAKRLSPWVVDTQNPSKVILISPLSNSICSPFPNFKWYKATDDTGISFYEIAINGSILATSTTTNKILSSPLNGGTNLWKVRAVDFVGNRGEWSSEWKLIVDNQAPTTPVLIKPFSGIWTNTKNINFVWRKSIDNLSGLSNYLIEISLNNFTNITTYKVISTNTNINISIDGNYKWRIKAIDKCGNESVSETRILNIDTTPPSLILNEIDKLYNPSVNFNWDAYDYGSGISKYIIHISSNQFNNYIAITQSANNKSLNYTLNYGNWNWRVYAYDSVGNFSVKTDSFTILNFNITVVYIEANDGIHYIEDISETSAKMIAANLDINLKIKLDGEVSNIKNLYILFSFNKEPDENNSIIQKCISTDRYNYYTTIPYNITAAHNGETIYIKLKVVNKDDSSVIVENFKNVNNSWSIELRNFRFQNNNVAIVNNINNNKSGNVRFIINNDVSERITIEIYTLSGEFLLKIADTIVSSGTHIYEWDLKNINKGVYIARIKKGEVTEFRPIVVY